MNQEELIQKAVFTKAMQVGNTRLSYALLMAMNEGSNDHHGRYVNRARSRNRWRKVLSRDNNNE